MGIAIGTVTAGKRWQFAQSVGNTLLGFAEGERPILINTAPDDTVICYKAGVKFPFQAPTLAATVGANLTTGAQYYVLYCYRRTIDGHISAPSPASAVATVSGSNLGLKVSGFLAPENGAYPFDNYIDQILLFVRPAGVGGVGGDGWYYWTNTTDSILEIRKNRKGDVGSPALLPASFNTVGDIRRAQTNGLLYLYGGGGGTSTGGGGTGGSGGSGGGGTSTVGPAVFTNPLGDQYVSTGIGTPAFTGTGLNNFMTGGRYTGTAAAQFECVIDGVGISRESVAAARAAAYSIEPVYYYDSAGNIQVAYREVIGDPVSAKNTLASSGYYTGTANSTFTIVVVDTSVVPNTFKWKKDNGAFSSPAAITNVLFALSDGVTARFQDNAAFVGTGYTSGSSWAINCFPSLPGVVDFSGNGKNDITITGTNTSGSSAQFNVQVLDGTSSPNYFIWNKNNGPYSAPIEMSTSPTLLSGGIYAQWLNTTGHISFDAWSFSCSSGLPSSPVFTGSGLNDAVSGGSNTIDGSLFIITIDTPNGNYPTLPQRFSWVRKSSRAVPETSGSSIPLSTSPITLAYGVTIRWGSTSGHTADYQWVISTVPATTYDTFKWRKDAGPYTTGVPCNLLDYQFVGMTYTGYKTLSDGFGVGFSSVSAHTLNDSWTTRCSAPARGLNDATSGGDYTNASGAIFRIDLSSQGGGATPDKFDWTKSGGGGATGVAITGSAQNLSDGVTIMFGATVGHLIGTYWTISATGLGGGGTRIAPTVFTGAGLNDCYSSGAYNGAANATFTFIVDYVAGSPNTFKWKKDSGSFTTGVAMTGAPQLILDGLYVRFVAITGHTLTDQWTVACTGTNIATNVGATVFTGSGLNDATSSGNYTGTTTSTYTATITATGTPDTYKWQKDANAPITAISVGTSSHLLSDGVYIQWAATTGHTVNDQWKITVSPNSNAGDSPTPGWSLLSMTFSQPDTIIKQGQRVEYTENYLLPPNRHGCLVGQRIITAGTATRTGATDATCTITNVFFAGKTRAGVQLTGETVSDGDLYKNFTVASTIIGTVFYVVSNTKFFLADAYDGPTIANQGGFKFEGQQFVRGSSCYNTITGPYITQTTAPQHCNPDSFLAQELKIGDQDEILDLTPISNSFGVWLNTRCYRIDTASISGQFRDAIANIVAITDRTGAVSRYSSINARNNFIFALSSQGILKSDLNSVDVVTDSEALRSYFMDKLNIATYPECRGQFLVGLHQTDYYLLYYLKSVAGTTFTQGVLYDVNETRLIPFNIGRVITEVLPCNDGNGNPVIAYGDASGNIGQLFKSGVFTNAGDDYTVMWQSGAADHGSPLKKFIGGINALQAKAGAAPWNLTLNVYAPGASVNLDSLPTPQVTALSSAQAGYRVNVTPTRATELFVYRLTGNSSEWPDAVSRISFDVQLFEGAR